MLEFRPRNASDARESKEGYEGIYAGDGIRQTDSFYEWLLSLLKPAPGSTLVDVACGEGRLVQLAVQRGVRAYGLDFSGFAIEKARSTVRQPSPFMIADGQGLPFQDGEFDYLMNIGSLEHYQDPNEGVREMSRILKPDGIACILVPNLYSILDNVWHVFRFGSAVIDEQPIQRYGDRLAWQSLLQRNGLLVVGTVKYQREWPLHTRDLLFYLRHAKALARLLLTPFVPLNLASCFVYLCRKQTP